MNTKKQRPTLKRLSVLSLALINSACVTIKDEVKCTVAGDITAGSICAHTNYDFGFSISMKETLSMLDAQPAKHCVPVGHWKEKKEITDPDIWIPDLNVCKEDQSTGVAIDLPARGSAIFVQPDSDNEKKIELETLCRMVGKNCKYEVIHESPKPSGSSPTIRRN